MKITSQKEYYRACFEREEIFDNAPEGNLDLLLWDTISRLRELTSAITEYEEERDKEESEELDKFHWYEAIDRTDVIRNIIHENLQTHPVIKQNHDLWQQVEHIVDLFGELYHAIGTKQPEE